MYRLLIRPLLFLIDPERIHHWLIAGIRFLFKIPGKKSAVTRICKPRSVKLERNVFGLHFDNPVGFAAGFDKNALVYNEFAAFGFSFIEIGTVTPKPQQGNPKPRLFRIPADQGLINRMGFNNDGAEAVRLRLLRNKPNVIVGANIGKNTSTPNHLAVEDYDFVLKTLYDVADYFVVNVSCPNIRDLSELQDKDMLLAILLRLTDTRRKMPMRKPLLLKISPDLSFQQIDETLAIIDQAGLDGIVATNTTLHRDNLLTPAEKLNAIGQGGLSGAPLSRRSTDIIQYIADKTGHRLPIIGTGGIMTPADAIEKLRAGASLIQVYTGFVYQGPFFVRSILKTLIKEQL